MKLEMITGGTAANMKIVAFDKEDKVRNQTLFSNMVLDKCTKVNRILIANWLREFEGHDGLTKKEEKLINFCVFKCWKYSIFCRAGGFSVALCPAWWPENK